MMRRITLASTTAAPFGRPSAVAASRAFGFRSMHTTGPLQYPNDQMAEDMRAKKREQMEKDIREGKLPEVNPDQSFSPESVVKKEPITRASQDAPIHREVSDDFAEENSAISDAQMVDKTLHVHEAPASRTGSSHSVVSEPASKAMGMEGVDEDKIIGGQGSKLREKMNRSEHDQKHTARGNLEGQHRDQEKILRSDAGSDLERGSADLGKAGRAGKEQHRKEWSSATSTSANASWSDLTKDQNVRSGSKAHHDLSSAASSSPFSEKIQKRTYSTSPSMSEKKHKTDAIIGDSPYPQMGLADLVGEKAMADDDKGTQAKKNDERLGAGWQDRIRDSLHDFSSGAAGAPARNMREKPVNSGKRNYSTMSHSSLRYPATFSVEGRTARIADVSGDCYMGWRVTKAQGSNDPWY